MASPNDRKYTETHEWILLNKNPAKIGITQYRAQQLGSVSAVALPDKNKNVSQGDEIGAITGASATHNIHSPVSGNVIDRDEVLFDTPGSINSDPYDAGWLVSISPSNQSQFENLLTAAEYDQKFPL